MKERPESKVLNCFDKNPDSKTSGKWQRHTEAAGAGVAAFDREGEIGANLALSITLYIVFSFR